MTTSLAHRLSTPACLFFFLFSLSSVHAGSALWKSNPVDDDWQTAENWTPAVVPNGETDTATFGSSAIMQIALGPWAVGETGTTTFLGEMIFAENAPPYTITLTTESVYGVFLEFYGAGMTNNSEVVQTIVNASSGNIWRSGASGFHNNATAGGANMVYINEGGASSIGDGTYGGFVGFGDSSTAGSATFINEGGQVAGTIYGGFTNVGLSSNSESATFISNPGDVAGAASGHTLVQTVGAIGDSTFIGNPAMVSGAEGGWTEYDYGTAAGANFIANGATVPACQAGQVYIYGGSGFASFIAHGGNGAGTEGGLLDFFAAPLSDQTIVLANGGTNGGGGGHIVMERAAITDPVQFQLYGNGLLDLSLVSNGNQTIGSLEGDGIVSLAGKLLQIGTNNFSTTFSGLIEGSGSLTKIGTGTLTLAGASTYSGATTVTAGALLVSNKTGSATGTGALKVNVGTLGGAGIIAGPVVLGTESGPGCTLAPAFGSNKQVTFTTQGNLTLHADCSFIYTFKSKGKKFRADQAVAKGVTITNANFVLQANAQGRLRLGTVLTVLNNTSPSPISGAFHNLPEGTVLAAGQNHLQASYEGGDGNDLTLTVVP